MGQKDMSVGDDENLEGEEEKHPESGRVMIWMAGDVGERLNLEGEKEKQTK